MKTMELVVPSEHVSSSLKRLSQANTFWIHVCALSCCHVQLFATPWTVANQASLSMGILQARILEGVAMPSSRGSSQPRD